MLTPTHTAYTVTESGAPMVLKMLPIQPDPSGIGFEMFDGAMVVPASQPPPVTICPTGQCTDPRTP